MQAPRATPPRGSARRRALLAPRQLAVVLAAAAAATVLLATCVAQGRTLVAGNETTLALGALLPLQIEHAPGVNGFRAIVELAVAEVNADPLVLPNHTVSAVFASTKSDERVAATAAQSLVSAGVVGIVGPMAGELSSVASFITSHGRTAHLDPASSLSMLASQEDYPFSARFSASSAAEADAIVKACVAQGWRRIGIVSGTNAVVEDMTLSLRDAGAAHGVEVVQPVQVTFDPRSDPEAHLGAAFDGFVSAIRDSHETRVWVFNVGGSYRKAFHRRLMQEGLLSPDSGFVWFNTANGAISRVEAAQLAAEVGMQGWTAGLGRAATRPMALTYDYAQPNPLTVALCDSVFGAGAYTDEVCAALPSSQAPPRLLYDAVHVMAAALHRLAETKAFCAAAASAASHDNCTALAADGGDDDVSLVRVLRSGTYQPRTPGFPIRFDPATGARLAVTAIAQINAEGAEPEVLVPLVVPPGAPAAMRNGDDFWSAQGLEIPPDRPAFVTDDVLPESETFVVLAALCGLGIVYCLCCAALTLAYRKERIVIMSSYRVNLVSAVGGATLLAVQLTGRAEFTSAVCSARLWIMTIGFSLLFGPMFAKAWRVYRIFGSKVIRTVRVTDWHLLRVVVALLVSDVALLGAWQLASPMRGKTTLRDPVATSNLSVYQVPVDEVCESEHDDIFYPLLFAWKGAALLVGSLLAFRTRNVKIKALNDASHIALAIFSTTMLATVALPVSFLIDSTQRDASFVLVTGSTLIIVLVSVTLVFVPKFVAIWGGTTDEWTSAIPSVDGTKMSKISHSGQGSGAGSRAGSRRGAPARLHRPPGGGSRPGVQALMTGGAPTLNSPDAPCSPSSESRPVRGHAAAISQPGSPLPVAGQV